MTTKRRTGVKRAPRRIGLISDVHGDLAALQDALTHLERLGVDEVLCAGDLLDWGPSPAGCIELLRAHKIRCVRGNHDFLDASGERSAGPEVLDAAAVSFIDSLPRTYERTIAGVRVVVTHASPGDDQRGIQPNRAAEVGAILASAAADILVVGHTHMPMSLAAPHGAIVNPGSILRLPTGVGRLPACGLCYPHDSETIRE